MTEFHGGLGKRDKRSAFAILPKGEAKLKPIRLPQIKSKKRVRA